MPDNFAYRIVGIHSSAAYQAEVVVTPCAHELFVDVDEFVVEQDPYLGSLILREHGTKCLDRPERFCLATG